MASQRDAIEQLLTEAAEIDRDISGWQQADQLPEDQLRATRRRYESWYSRARKFVLEERRADFVDMYEGGFFTPRIRKFLSDPLEISPIYDAAAPNPLISRWVYEYPSTFRDPFVRQQSMLSEALESTGEVVRHLNELADQFRRLPEYIATLSRYDRAATPAPHLRNEADLQALLHALLRILYEDVRQEDPAPKRAGASSRVDFSIPTEKLVIEAKMTRKGLADRKVGEELLIDWGRYEAHPDCEGILAIVYDPDRRIENAAALESDLTRQDRVPATRVIVVR